MPFPLLKFSSEHFWKGDWSISEAKGVCFQSQTRRMDQKHQQLTQGLLQGQYIFVFRGFCWATLVVRYFTAVVSLQRLFRRCPFIDRFFILTSRICLLFFFCGVEVADMQQKTSDSKQFPLNYRSFGETQFSWWLQFVVWGSQMVRSSEVVPWAKIAMGLVTLLRQHTSQWCPRFFGLSQLRKWEMIQRVETISKG